MNLSIYKKVYRRENFYATEEKSEGVKLCAICEFEGVSKDLCKKCYETYCSEGIPDWVKALIEMEQRRRYVEKLKVPRILPDSR